MATTHLYSAADGNLLDGRVGACGVVHLAWRDDDTYNGPHVQFYGGTAAAHALQMNGKRLMPGSLGYLGSFAGSGVIFDPYTLAEIGFPRRVVFDQTDERQEMLWQGQTHVAWDPDDPLKFIVPRIDGHFWEYDLRTPEKPTQLGEYLVTVPHALKRCGNFLVYGGMDSNTKGPAREIGIYDIAKKRARVIHLRETCWHLTVGDDHNGRPCVWAVSECYEQGTAKPGQTFNYDDLAIGYRINWVWKIDLETLQMWRVISQAAEPSHMSSDVVSLGDEFDTVLHNCCGSSTIAITEIVQGMPGARNRWIDERVTLGDCLRHPGLFRAANGNLVAAAILMHLPGNTHHLVRALKVSRGSLLDGSYGLVLNRQRTRLFSGHRGLNQIIVYDFTALKADDPGPFVRLPVVARIQLPPLRTFFPRIWGVLSDPRLGLHHMTSLEEK